jgi:hypothetical protein
MTTKTQIKTITLSETEKQRLLKEGSNLAYPINGQYEAFIQAATLAVMRALSPSTRNALSQIKNGAAPAAPVVVKNLPYDARVKRGMVNPECIKTGKPNDLSETLLTGFVGMIGEPYAISYQGRGLISNLSPKKSHLHTNTGLGADKELSAHVENSAARLINGDRAPDGLALIGVAPEKASSPGTMVTDGRMALQLVGPEIEAVLRDPAAFSVNVPERWRMHSDSAPARIPTAIVYGSDTYPSFVGAMYGDMLKPNGRGAEAALEAFQQALDDVSVDLLVDPGTLAFIDNHVLWHGRRKFAPSFDSEGRPYRFIQRLYWTSTMRRFGSWQSENTRLITPTF